MDQCRKERLAASIAGFRMPQYQEIPDVGLYLEQTAKYITDYLAPLGESDLTGSMISNYVKKKLVTHPVKKQYSREQIAQLFFVAVAKTVLSIDDISLMLSIQRKTYLSEIAYDYFCKELVNVLHYVFGLKDAPDTISISVTDEKVMLHNVIITAAHKVYLNQLFRVLQSERDPAELQNGSSQG